MFMSQGTLSQQQVHGSFSPFFDAVRKEFFLTSSKLFTWFDLTKSNSSSLVWPGQIFGLPPCELHCRVYPAMYYSKSVIELWPTTVRLQVACAAGWELQFVLSFCFSPNGWTQLSRSCCPQNQKHSQLAFKQIPCFAALQPSNAGLVLGFSGFCPACSQIQIPCRTYLQ